MNYVKIINDKKCIGNSNTLRELFISFSLLGFTAFGGPIAHLGYFREEFVLRRKWLNEDTYLSIVTMCNFLPGPSSSQVGILIGMMRGGILGAIVAWCSFTLPSAIILIAFASYYSNNTNNADYIWLHGLKLVAVAIISQAVVGMTSTRRKDLRPIFLICLSSFICIMNPSQITQFIVIILGALYGLIFLIDLTEKTTTRIPIYVNRELAKLSALILVSLMIISFIFIYYSNNALTKLLAEMFVIGSTVFGGGHVVLPMLNQVVVASGLMSNDVFLSGYGMAQAIPGPLFTFSSYLGAALVKYPFNLIYGILCLIAIFLPSFLLLNIVVPIWNNVQNNKNILSAIKGIESVVIGILAAALYNPVYLNTVKSQQDNILVVLMFFLLVFIKLPSYFIIIIGILSGYVTSIL